MQHDGFLNKFAIYRAIPEGVRDVIEMCLGFIIAVFGAGFISVFVGLVIMTAFVFFKSMVDLIVPWFF